MLNCIFVSILTTTAMLYCVQCNYFKTPNDEQIKQSLNNYIFLYIHFNLSFLKYIYGGQVIIYIGYIVIIFLSLLTHSVAITHLMLMIGKCP